MANITGDIIRNVDANGRAQWAETHFRAVKNSAGKTVEDLDNEVNQLDQELNGLPAVTIDLDDYDTINGMIDDGRLKMTSNYAYRRCKFVSVSSYHGRTIRMLRNTGENDGPVIYAFLAAMPDTTQNSDVTFATGYTRPVIATQTINDVLVPDDAAVLYILLKDTRYETDNTPSGVSVLAVDGEVYTKEETDALISPVSQKLNNILIKLVGFGTGGPAAGVVNYGDVYYNTSTKLLRRSAPGEYETVPYIDGAIYTCKGDFYIWNGTDLVLAPVSLYPRVAALEEDMKSVQDELIFGIPSDLSLTTYEQYGYVKASQTIGEAVQIISAEGYGSVLVGSVPAGKRAKVKFTDTSGNYGYALCTSEGIVLEYTKNSASESTEYVFAAPDEDAVLYVSGRKLAGAEILDDIPVKDIVEELWEDQQTENSWRGKTIWWCGTSIPAGGYPQIVGTLLGATVINQAVGSSMCRANVRTGDYVGAHFSNITSALSMTDEEVEAFITNYDTIKENLIGDAPASLSADNLARLRAASFEKRLLPYLDGTEDMPDLFVFDHGHNDFKYKLSNNTSDIGLEPTVENIGDELTEDTFMTANDCAKMESFLGSLDDIPSSQKAAFIASLNRNCYIGAVNFLVTLILHYNPRARIVFISNYEYEHGTQPKYAPLIPAQESIAESWALPLCEIYKKLGYSDHLIPGSKAWFNAAYPSRSAATEDIPVQKVYCADGVHPASDVSGTANRIYAGILAGWLQTVR